MLLGSSTKFSAMVNNNLLEDPHELIDSFKVLTLELQLVLLKSHILFIFSVSALYMHFICITYCA